MPDLRQGCTTGKSSEDTAPSDALVLFGAMGDLAHKKIFPALCHMVRRGHLDVPVIGIARAGRTNEHLKERVRDSVQQQGEDVAPLVTQHNRDFALCYHRWFAALYRDKYEYLGEYDLLRLAFLLDLGLYYLGVASQPFKRGKMALCEPVFASRRSTPFYVLMRSYNRRFAEMARSRRERAGLGRRNAGRRFMFRGFTFSWPSTLSIFAALGGWARLELTEGWRSWWQRPVGADRPDPLLIPVRGATPQR